MLPKRPLTEKQINEWYMFTQWNTLYRAMRINRL